VGQLHAACAQPEASGGVPACVCVRVCMRARVRVSVHGGMLHNLRLQVGGLARARALHRRAHRAQAARLPTPARTPTPHKGPQCPNLSKSLPAPLLSPFPCPNPNPNPSPDPHPNRTLTLTSWLRGSWRRHWASSLGRASPTSAWSCGTRRCT